jgi:hypothetical protein
MINGRRGGPPIKIPFAIRTSDPVLSTFFGEVRRAIQGLRDSIPQMPNRVGGGAAPHPFQLSQVENAGSCRLHVWQGAVTSNQWVWDSTHVYGETQEIVAGIGSGAMLSPSVSIGDVGAGYLTLTASTTYGIWLKVNAYDPWGTVSAYSPQTGKFPTDVSYHFANFVLGTAVIVSSSTNTDSGDSLAESAVTSGAAHSFAIYLGKAVVDANGIATLTQYRSSDVALAPPLLTAPIIVSTDTSGGTNTITEGSDGGAYLP